jgi:hypothetical protein
MKRRINPYFPYCYWGIVMDIHTERAVVTARKVLREHGAKTYVHSRRLRNILSHVFSKDEEMILRAKQSRLESVSPIRVVATNRRIIIVKPSFWGLYTGYDLSSPTDYVIIPYKYIIGVTISKGKILSSIKIHTSGGSDTYKGSTRGEENEVRGLLVNDAAIMARFIQEIIEYGDEGTQTNFGRVSRYSYQSSLTTDEALKVLHSNMGRFVWLGAESAEEIAAQLGVEPWVVLRISPEKLLGYDSEQLIALGPIILASYIDAQSEQVSSAIKKKFGIEVPVLKGGIRLSASSQY